MRPSAKLRRANWLVALQRLLTTALVFICLDAALRGARIVLGPARAHIPLDPHARLEPTTLHAGVILDPRGTLSVLAIEPSVAQRVLDQLATLPTAALVAVMLVLLRQLLRGVRHSDPFTPMTVHRLRVLAGVMILGGLLAELIQFAAQSALATTMITSQTAIAGQSWFPRLAALPAAVESRGWWLLAGVGFLAVAEIVNRGLGMRTELDEVI